MDHENKPKWLLELENRKRKPRLAHETGAGAPCLTCESLCPGLDLHFWRKICKNCKCRGDNHDFDADDFPQFELLFGLNLKNKKTHSVLLKVNIKKQFQTETPFDWIPPDTTEELAADYMKAIPLEKMPIKGSVGAAFRKQQLQKQIPLHDIDHKACDRLSEQEKKEFEKYLDNLKNCAGQGKVSKFAIIQSFNVPLMTPANATDVLPLSPQHSQQLLSQQREVGNLRTPSSFLSKKTQTNIKSNFNTDDNTPSTSNINIIKEGILQSSKNLNTKLGQYHHALVNVSNDNNFAEIDKVSGTYYSPLNLNFSSNQHNFSQNNLASSELKFANIPDSVASEEYVQFRKPYKVDNILDKFKSCTETMEKMSNQAVVPNSEFSNDIPVNALFYEQMSCTVLPPSNINANDIVGSSLDEKGLTYIREQLKDKYSNKNKYQSQVLSSQFNDRNESLACNAKTVNISENTEMFKNKSSSIEDNKSQTSDPIHYVPHSEFLAADINISLPIQSNVIHSDILNTSIFPENVIDIPTSFQNSENINQLQKQIGDMTMSINKYQNCHKCKQSIHYGDIVVTAEKIKDEIWHPSCFVCSACNELLVDLVYFIYKEKLYCGRDLAEHLEIPRCFACDELIFVREYTVAEGNNYHVKHFCCWECDIPLAGQQYISENDKPLCLPCYQNNYAKTCSTCHKVIDADQQGVSIKNLNFHATDNCFCCFICNKSLFDGQIAIKQNKPLCNKECITEFIYRIALKK